MMHHSAKDTQSDIDFVITWVDGSDKDWQKNKLKYSSQAVAKSEIDESIYRYRDWNNLQFLLRGIEEFTPWVRKVHFVTYGHVPSWLNLNCKKLNVVRHDDYIPKEYLPTFNSSTIELHLHRIKGLSDKFVYFNDDMFITKPMKPSDFFVNGLPCDRALIDRIVLTNPNDIFPYTLLTHMGVLNKNFKKNGVIAKNLFKWISIKYRIVPLIKSMLLMPYRDFSGLAWCHLPSPLLKSTFEEVWIKEPELLHATSQHKFRHAQDIFQYIFKGWQILSGNFHPLDYEKNSRMFYDLSAQKEDLYKAIRKQEYPMICINDTEACTDFEEIRDEIVKNFECILPDKSTFEL